MNSNELSKLTEDLLKALRDQLLKDGSNVDEEYASRNMLNSSIAINEKINVQLEKLEKECINTILHLSTAKPTSYDWNTIEKQVVSFIDEQNARLQKESGLNDFCWDPYKIKAFKVKAQAMLSIEGKKRAIKEKCRITIWNIVIALLGGVAGSLLTLMIK